MTEEQLRRHENAIVLVTIDATIKALKFGLERSNDPVKILESFRQRVARMQKE